MKRTYGLSFVRDFSHMFRFSYTQREFLIASIFSIFISFKASIVIIIAATPFLVSFSDACSVCIPIWGTST